MENINKKIEAFREYLISEEKSENTIEKYMRDVRAFREWCERRAAACCRREEEQSQYPVGQGLAPAA